MEIGIKAKEIMNKDFCILDSSLTLETCLKKLDNKYEGCVILNNGSIHTIISYDNLLRNFFIRRKKDVKLEEIEAKKNFVVVAPDLDVSKIIELMTKARIDFILVRDKNEFGLITKDEIAEINQLLFDKLENIEIINY